MRARAWGRPACWAGAPARVRFGVHTLGRGAPHGAGAAIPLGKMGAALGRRGRGGWWGAGHPTAAAGKPHAQPGPIFGAVSVGRGHRGSTAAIRPSTEARREAIAGNAVGSFGLPQAPCPRPLLGIRPFREAVQVAPGVTVLLPARRGRAPLPAPTLAQPGASVRQRGTRGLLRGPGRLSAKGREPPSRLGGAPGQEPRPGRATRAAS